MVQQIEMLLPALGRGFHLVTPYILSKLPELPENGLLHIMLLHTSAGLTINENADSSVRMDFENFMNRLVPVNRSLYSHTLEGLDDMPAHIKSSLFGQSLTIPVTGHRLNLGTWQGIYLCEFRNNSGPRSLVITLLK